MNAARKFDLQEAIGAAAGHTLCRHRRNAPAMMPQSAEARTSTYATCFPSNMRRMRAISALTFAVVGTLVLKNMTRGAGLSASLYAAAGRLLLPSIDQKLKACSLLPVTNGKAFAVQRLVVHQAVCHMSPPMPRRLVWEGNANLAPLETCQHICMCTGCAPLKRRPISKVVK